MLDNNTLNLAHDLWLQQDQLVMLALISSLFKPLIAQIVRCTSVRAVWLFLESTYALVSQACLLQTSFQGASLKKGLAPFPLAFVKPEPLPTSW